MLIGVVGWIILGFIVGFVASKIVKLHGDDPKLGIIMGGFGGLIGGWLYSWLGGVAVSEFNMKSLLFAAVASAGALVLWHGWRWKSAV